MPHSTDIVLIGLAITSSWGNGHATTYRSLVKGLHQRGYRVLFLERDQPWYAQHRDAPRSEHWDTQLYCDLADLKSRFAERVRSADAVIVGSYVPEGSHVCAWVLENARGVRAFYDIDTPVTLTNLRTDACDYLRADQIPEFDLLLSFTGGPTLQRLESLFGARCARALYCSVDVDQYRPQALRKDLELGYMGTYSADRQPGIDTLLSEPARRMPERTFAVVGAQYPESLMWPPNMMRIEHLPPSEHPSFYSRQRYTLNVTRADMRRAGHSPSVRLFEAAACGTPIITDDWPGLDEMLSPHEQVLIARDAADVVRYLGEITDSQRDRIAGAARERVLAEHSSAHRARELEEYIESARREAAHSRALPGNGGVHRSCVAM